MDNLLGWAIWSGSGFIVAGLVGYKRGATSTGMILGIIFGPLLGTLALLFATRAGSSEVSRP